MFRIGEFSKINRVTVKALRLYEKLGLLKSKIVDSNNKYRYYDSSQFQEMQKILALKQAGFSLNEIDVLLKENLSTNDLMKILDKKSLEIQNTLRSEKDKLLQLQTYIHTLEKENKMNNHISVKELPSVIIASMRKVISGYDELFTFYPSCGKLMEKAGAECVTPEYCFTLFHDGEYKEKDIDVEICQAVKKFGKQVEGLTFRQLEAIPKAACLFHKGPYSTIGRSYAILMKWIEENEYRLSGPIRESAIDGIWNKDNPEDWLTEIQAPVEKKK